MSALAEPRVESPPPASGALNLVDAENPWLGLDSFTEETRGFFHGREEEIAELARRVQRKLLAILFGQSGLGKTSILRAGIVPRLRREGYCPVYVRIDYAPESPSPSEQIKQAIFRATEAQGQWTRPGTSIPGESLWEFLHHRDDVLRDASGKALTPLLIFDQFEEIFTLGQDDDFGRKRAAQFIEDLADLVENRPPRSLEVMLELEESIVDRFDFSRADYRILIALREDYLAHLEGLKGSMPSITQNRMRLARMTGEQALAAVTKPGGRLVSEEVAEAIVRFIAGGAELRNAEVEPSLLSLVCRELNNARIAQGRGEISADLLAGSRDTILNEFYERSLGDQPAGVRRFIEDEMLTESGFRESLAEERVLKAFTAAGAPAGTLPTLVNRRLLRIEERLDVRRVELTHDVLCSVVRASRDMRHEREARDEAERQLQAQRDREAATRRALVRARQIAVGCAVLSVVALAGAIFGWTSMKRAQEAETKALGARQAAEGARGEAEKLIVYLLDDFYQELEPVGRLDIVGDLSKRALAYYAGLPPELRSPETDRNRALALVRYGHVLRYQAKLPEAVQAFTEANGILEKLRNAGDRSEFTTIGLALGYTGIARALDSRGRDPESEKYAMLSADVLGPLMAVPNPSVRVRLAYGVVMNYLGFNQLRQAREEESVKSLDIAREAFRSVDGLKIEHLAAAAGYAEATAWQMEALTQLGRIAEARRNGEEALKVAQQILERRPGHMPALRAHALISTGIARSEVESLHLRKALQASAPVTGDWEMYLKLDPSNSIASNNLAATHAQLAFGYDAIGRSDLAREHLRKTIEIANRIPEIKGNFMFGAGRLAVLEAELGVRAAPGEKPEYRRMTEDAIARYVRDPFQRDTLGEFAGFFDRQVALTWGRYDEVRDSALAAMPRVEALKPGNEGQRRIHQRIRAGLAGHAAIAYYNLRDYPAAEAQARRSLEDAMKVPTRGVDDEVTLATARVYLALALGRNGKQAEAAKLVGPDLAFARGLIAKGSDDLNHRILLVQAQLAAAIASPAQARALLAEASANLDMLPRDMAQRQSVQQLRGWVAEEMRKQS